MEQSTQQQNKPNTAKQSTLSAKQSKSRDMTFFHCVACRIVFTRENDYNNHLQEQGHHKRTAQKEKYDKKILDKLEKDKQGKESINTCTKYQKA